MSTVAGGLVFSTSWKSWPVGSHGQTLPNTPYAPSIPKFDPRKMSTKLRGQGITPINDIARIKAIADLYQIRYTPWTKVEGAGTIH